MIDSESDIDGQPGKPARKDRKIGRILIPALIVVLALTAFGLSRFYSWATGASGPRTPIIVEIADGSTGSQVADLLQAKHVIRSSLGFKILVRVKHSGDFRAGRYRMTTNMTASQALAALEQPVPITQIKVTIPEGFDIAQTAARVSQQLNIPTSAFVKAANSGDYIRPPYLSSGKAAEGFLFPNTYQFYEDATAADVINEQLDQFVEQARSLHLTDKAKALGLSPYQVVVVASMIEEEARYQKDRVRVAEVIYNRLEQGMRLQVDATTAYAVGKLGQKLTSTDYESKSPYNTYTHDGLPPGPISNPGRLSLQAALNPAKGDFLYYVVIDKDGHEAFTSSYEEFLNLKAQAPA
jgi:UPF0755 protein